MKRRWLTTAAVIVLTPVVAVIGVDTPPVAFAGGNPANGDCQAEVPENCVATFVPASAGAGDSVTVTLDPSGVEPLPSASYLVLSNGVDTRFVALDDVNNRMGTFVMPVLPATGTWSAIVYSGSDLQGVAAIQYTGPVISCAVGFDGVLVNDTTLCERRFTVDGTLVVPADIVDMQVLVVGAGGGGGGGLADSTTPLYGAGGGGGGGEVKQCTDTVLPGDELTVTIGAGGTAADVRSGENVSGPGGDGTWSVIEETAEPGFSCLAEGGRGGASADGQSNDGTGGSSGSGSEGGAGEISDGVSIAGGGGGGHADVGADGSSSGGAGGAGADLSASWFADFDGHLGGGGGGGSIVTSGSAQGGLGTDGGGNGTSCVDDEGVPSCSDGAASLEANSPKLNSGGGGGGGAGAGAAGDGASGIVIARYEYVESITPTPVVGGAWIEGAGDQTCAAYASISAAVVAADAGDVIHICPGVYREPTIVVDVDNLTFVGDGMSELDVLIDGGGTGDPESSGGHQIISASGMSVTFRNLTLRNGFIDCDDPAAGTGGAAVHALTVTAHDVVFDKNVTCYDGTSEVGGGAVYAQSVSITDSTFTANGYSKFGGALYLSGSGASTITGSTFSNNITSDQTGALGGAVFVSPTSSLTIESSQFVFNGWVGNAPTSGGAVYSKGALTVEGSTFADNGAAQHGGAVTSEETTSVTSTTFRSNVTGSDGSALRVSGELVVDSSTFESNIVFGEGAGTISSTSTGASGDDLSVINSTFYANSASNAAALDAQGSVSVTFVTAVDNSTGEGSTLMRSTGDLTIENSLFARNSDGDASIGCNGNSLTTNANVSDEDSCADAASESLTFGLFTHHNGSSTKTLALVAGSPAVDAGDCSASTPDEDQNGVARPQGTRCDAGAFEFTGYTGTERACPRDSGTTVVGTDAQTGYPICQRVYSQSGTSSFVTPMGVTDVDVVVVGGGGGGGGGTDAQGAVIAGGGGAGGSVAIRRDVPVTAGTSYQVVVGSGGAGGAGSTDGRGSNGSGGGTSSFESAVGVAGGGGGSGGGFDGSSYITGSGGTTAGVASTSNITGHGSMSGGDGAPGAAWDVNRYFSAGGGGAGAGGSGTSGLFGTLIGTISTQFAGSGGRGIVPFDPESLFASPGWIDDLPSTFPADTAPLSQVEVFGLAPGGGGGASLVLNDDTYLGSCGTSRTLNALGSDASAGRGLATTLDSGEYTEDPDDLIAPDVTVCDAATAASFGAGGGGGIGSADLANGLAGRAGTVIVRYVAGGLPACSASNGTASTTTINGVVEMIIISDCVFVAPTGVTSVDALVIGGGGAGATDADGLGAGGGGGGGEVVLCTDVTVTVPVTAQIGAGGTWLNGLFLSEAGASTFGGSSCTAQGGQFGEIGTEFIPAGLFGDTPDADLPASGGNGGTSGNASIGGTGSLFSWTETPGVAPDEMYASAGGGGAGAGGAGASPSCGAPVESFVDGKYDGDYSDITCGSSAGGAGVAAGSLTGASTSLFNGDTQRFGGGGGGASSNPLAGGTLGADGGGSGATAGSTFGGNATAFGGGGGGGFSTFIFGPAEGELGIQSMEVLDGPPVTGSGYQGAVIVRYLAEEEGSVRPPKVGGSPEVCLDAIPNSSNAQRDYSPMHFCLPMVR